MTRIALRLAATAALVLGAIDVPAKGAAPEAPPAWLLELARRPVTMDTGDSACVVLLDETLITIGADGRHAVSARSAIRILKREGRDRAIARVPYAAVIDKVKSLQAWLISADGRRRTFGRKETVDIATSPDMLYADTRSVIIDASAEAVAGDVFAWESARDEVSVIGQGVWVFQDSDPVALSRVTLRVPKGWRVDGRMRGHEPMAPSIDGTGFTWQLTSLPAVSEEPLSPGPFSSLAHLAYDLRPPENGGRPQAIRTFSSWADTVAYSIDLHTRPAAADATTKARARELCAAATSPWEKIAALAACAQGLRYVAIAMNLGSGGGYTPHPAAEVLRCGYGDCKDKTTLLRALLAAEGIKSWPVLCHSGDPTAVRDDWPSPMQFNHVLTAIELGDIDAPPSPFILDQPGLGRVVLFDPTDPYTWLGDYPGYNQGGRVLICAPGTTALTRVPVAPPENNHHRRRAKVAIQADGAARVGAFEVFSGTPAAEVRGDYAAATDLKEAIEKQLLPVHPAVQITRAELGTTSVPGQISLRTSFGAPRFCRTIREQMLLFTPVLRTREARPPLPDGPRRLPILLPSFSVDDVTEFILPEGFTISELAAPAVHERVFGSYELRLTASEGKIFAHRRITMRGGELPPEQYPDVSTFFEAIRTAETTPVVLERIAPN